MFTVYGEANTVTTTTVEPTTIPPQTGQCNKVLPSESMPVKTKHLYNICTMLDQRRRRWADVVQMVYKCFVFDGMT